MNLGNSDVRIGLEELGIPLEEVAALGAPGPYPEVVERLEDLQTRAKKAYKDAAFRLHPDRNSDPGAAEKFRIVASVADAIANLRVRHPFVPTRIRRSRRNLHRITVKFR